MSAAGGRLPKFRCDGVFIVGRGTEGVEGRVAVLNEGAFVKIRQQFVGVNSIFDQVVHPLRFVGFRKEPIDRRH